MAKFVPDEYCQSDSLQKKAFDCLEQGDFIQADELFMQLVPRFEFKLQFLRHDEADIVNLGKVRRGWTEALWHIGRYEEALLQIRCCELETCHEYSEEAARLWKDRGACGGDTRVAFIAYEIAACFTPPNMAVEKCYLLCNLVALCFKSEPVMLQEALKFIVQAFQLDASPSQELAKMWMECGKKLVKVMSFVSRATKCFDLALKYLPRTDSGMNSKIRLLRAQSILAGNVPNLLEGATNDVRTYTERHPRSTKGFSLLWKCHLRNGDYNKTLEAFRKVMDLIDQEENREKEFVDLFETATKQKAFELFNLKCPAPTHFVQNVVNECAAKNALQEISFLFLGGWADDCEASSVPLDLVLEANLTDQDELVECLLRHKARAEGLGGSGQSPLSVSIQSKNYAMAVTLLQHGADPVDLVEKDGETPLQASLRIGLATGEFSVMQFLLDKQRDSVNAQDKEGNTVLHLVCRGKNNKKKQEALGILLNAAADPSISNRKGEKPIDVLLNLSDNRRNILSLYKASTELSSTSEEGRTKQSDLNNKKELVQDENALPRQLENAPSSLNSNKSKASPLSSAKSKKTFGKEPLSAVRDRVRSFIMKLDIREQLKHVFYQEKLSRKLHVENEIHNKDGDKSLENQKKSADVESSADNNCNLDPSRAGHQEEVFNRDDAHDASLTTTSESDIYGAFEGLPWEVECTAEVWKILRGKRLESWKKKQFVEKVRNLALGRDNWTFHHCQRLEGLPKSYGMLLYETRLTDAARIIWECAVAFSPRYSNEEHDRKTKIYSEIIRVWDIVFDHDNVPRKIENIVKSYRRGQGCILTKELKGIPRGEMASDDQGPNLYWKVSEPTIGASPTQEEVKGKMWKDQENAQKVTFFPPASHDDNEYQVLKFYHFSTAMIQTILQKQPGDVEVDFPFRVTEEEHDIINYHPSPQSSIILIGRSGTGKTTCVLYRLWKDFMSYWNKAVESGPLIPRKSVFVPKARTDTEAADSGGEGSEERTDPDVPDTETGNGVCGTAVNNFEAATSSSSILCAPSEAEADEVLENLHQLFVTKNGVLCEEIQKNFNALSQACSFKVPSHKPELPPAMKLQDAEDSSTGWPLFLNAHNLYLLLDASLPETPFFPRAEDGSLLCKVQDWGEEDNQLATIPLIDDGDDHNDGSEDEDSDEEDEMSVDGDESTLATVPCMTLVSYTIFETLLWKKMCKKKKKVNFHPSLVWMEIRSFIKGSFEALHSELGHLSLESYQIIGQKRAPNFTGDREAIYKLFESYQRIKGLWNMFDENDLVFHLYHRLRRCGVPEWSIHNLYVDETQDFTQAELMLLIRCCRDPNGVFLTGDTAQGVMRGISFRFEDLRSLFFYLKKSYKAVGTQAEVIVPEIKPLVHNYRSHSGILNLASSVVSILQEYFPESFDTLDKDQGQLDGPKPVLLESCSHSDLAIILRGNQRKTSTIEFGAHQAILVSSNEARECLPEELSQALVLTIYEAKGLEFDDVLIYNFFKDSQGHVEWRVVTQFLLNYHGEDLNPSEIVSRPLCFNSDKHKILNSELKQLYTAVTRARAKVWFFDEDVDKRRPVFEYFQHLGLAEVVKLEQPSDGNTVQSQSLENMFSKGSTLDEWEKQGAFFYRKKLWRVAQKCFEISGNKEMNHKCKAYLQAEHARGLSSEPRLMRTEFLLAADQFLQNNMVQEAKACLYNARERFLYASLLQQLDKEKTAAKWFEKNGNFLEAGRCLESIADYREAVEVLIRGNLYSQAIDVLKRYSGLPTVDQSKCVPPARSVEELCLASAELHFKRGDFREMNALIQHISSVDARVDFLKKRKFFEEAARELLKVGRGIDAAKILRENGSLREACQLAQENGDLNFAADCIFADVRSSKGRTQDEQTAELEQAKELYEEAGNRNSIAEVLLKQAQLANDSEKAIEAEKLFTASQVSNTCGALECIEFLCDAAGEDCTIQGMKTWIAIKTVKDVLELIRSLTSNDRNMLMQKKLDVCEEHFGVLKEGDSSKRAVRRKEGDRFLTIVQGLEKRPLPGNKWEFGLEDVRERIAESLFCRVDRVIRHIRGVLNKVSNDHSTCQKLLTGFSCDTVECHYRHNLPSEESIETLFWAMLDEIFLDAQADNFRVLRKKYDTQNTAFTRSVKRQLSLSNSIAQLEDPFPGDSFTSCVKLLDFFFCRMGQSASIFLTKYIEFVRDRRRRIHRQRLERLAVEMWNKPTAEERLSDVNLFLIVSNILQLIGSPSSKILSWIKKEQDNFTRTYNFHGSKSRIPDSVGIALERKEPPTFTFFVKWWEDSKLFLHLHGYILEAGHHAVRRFLAMTVNPGKKLPYPSPSNFLAILEYQMCVLLTLYARCIYSQGSGPICLPESYMSVMKFWDTLHCTTKKHLDIFHAASLFTIGPKTIRQVQSILRHMVFLMFGEYSPNFNVVVKVRSGGSFAISGETERALVLTLTMLCNCGHALPPECELKLLEHLTLGVPGDVELPARIEKCLDQVRQAKGIRDIVVILQDLLEERQERLYDVRWCNYPCRLSTTKVNPDLFLENFGPNVLETLAKNAGEKILSEKDESASVDVEDALVNESDVHAEDELSVEFDPSRTETYEEIEKELAQKNWTEAATGEETVAAEFSNEEPLEDDPTSSFFSSVRVDGSGCGICNVIFADKNHEISESPANDREPWQWPGETGQHHIDQSGAIVDSTHQVESRNSHLAENSPHREKQQLFEDFKTLFKEHLSPLLMEQDSLLKEGDEFKHIADQQGKPSAFLASKLSEVKRAETQVMQEATTIRQKCTWGDLETFRASALAFQKALEVCRKEIAKERSRDTGKGKYEKQLNVLQNPWLAEEELDHEIDAEYFHHVPGLRKKKKERK